MVSSLSLTHKWTRLAFLNLLVLAGVGLLLRYKIVFPLPMVDQKHLLHAHSHFAFAGWASLAVYAALLHVLRLNERQSSSFERLLWLQQLSSYGMLFSFPFTGYAPVSIAFSTLSIIVSYAFSWKAWKQLAAVEPGIAGHWFRTALICNVLSSLGTFALAWMMATKNLHQDWYFGSVYFFLHFQYNGWFLFAVLGLLFYSLRQGLNTNSFATTEKNVWLLLVAALVPSLFLSLMWMRIPGWMYIAGIVAAALQLVGLTFFIQLLKKVPAAFYQRLPLSVKWLGGFSLLAFILKLLMQALSAIPALSRYAFGLRPVVIGFLHLVLLGFITLFLVSWFLQQKFYTLHNRTQLYGLWIFFSGILLNELILFSQGMAAIFTETIPYSGYLLVFAALWMFTGLLLLVLPKLFFQQTSAVR
jgi:hypothetical protein